jgi:hypothetical protein
MTETLTATWVVAGAEADPDEIESWCRAVADRDGSDTFVQVGPGRGLLASGRGALLIGTAPELEPGPPAWATGWHAATFRLRQVNAPDVEPDPTATPTMLLTRTYVPPETQEEFRRWLITEHSQRQLTVPGNNWYRGYEELGERHSFMNLWGLDAIDVAGGGEWDRVRLTPWRERMAPAMEGMDRAFYRPVGRSSA